jgi:trehalose 6-phosphate phosphatase
VDAEALLGRLAQAPERAALLLDVDGTLAPIVPRPEDARVPDETRPELRRLAARYGLVACVSGRPGAEARRIVGLDELCYVGEHGLELDPRASEWAERMRAFAAGTTQWPAERKPLTLSYHWRTAPDEDAAVSALEEVAARARESGLVPRWGRKVLEVRPPIGAHKGTAVLHLLSKHGLERALYAGDDTTDLDAFAALDGLELAVRVAVASPEGPAKLEESADVVVGGPAGMLELLRTL